MNNDKIIEVEPQPNSILQPQQDQNAKPVAGTTIHQSSQTFTSNSTTEQSKVPFGRYFRSDDRKQALFYILAPVLFMGAVQILPILWIFSFLASPVLAISFFYGILLLFRNRKFDSSIKLSEPTYKKTYKSAILRFVIGSILMGIGYLFIWLVEKSAGYAGSEGGIVAFPFFICGFIFLLLAFVSMLTTFFANMSSKKS